MGGDGTSPPAERFGFIRQPNAGSSLFQRAPGAGALPAARALPSPRVSQVSFPEISVSTANHASSDFDQNRRGLGWGGWIRTTDYLIQSQEPYRLATPQRVNTRIIPEQPWPSRHRRARSRRAEEGAAGPRPTRRRNRRPC